MSDFDKRHNSLMDWGPNEGGDHPELGHYGIPTVKGNFDALPQKVQDFIDENIILCQPKGIYICDGSPEEGEEISQKLVERGLLHPLSKYPNSYVVRTDPADVARVESKTVIITKDKHDAVPHVKEGVKGTLGQWMSVDDWIAADQHRYPGCMKGRLMYVIPFCMGPVGSPLSKIGIQLTDFNYVVLCMRVMTRVGDKVLESLGDGDFVKCVHSIGAPRPLPKPPVSHWPCNPDEVLIAHFPKDRMVMSFGSGYGGNSLLGKKCFALRIAGCIAKDEGWMAEHMLIMSVTNPAGVERFIAAAFPSACGKTNMAMLEPTLPGWKVQVVGDDIAWMRFDAEGRLRGINPECGFFGVAPGTNEKTNPMALATCRANTVFTNVAITDDGGVYWEGLEKEVDPNVGMTNWLGERWKIGQPGQAAHANSRFCCPAGQCPIIHPKWEDPEGVPIDAIVFGGRRPTGVPLIFETLSWEHGVAVGASIKSESTAAAEFKGRQIMHDPMAMRPFFGYNFGHYLQHWLDMKKPGRHMPKIFHVNWFRLDSKNKFLWPGFGDNIRVIDWMLKRCNGDDVAEPSPIGLLPKPGSIDLSGLGTINWDELFSLPKDYWTEDIAETKQFLEEQVGVDLPAEVRKELDEQEQRIKAM